MAGHQKKKDGDKSAGRKGTGKGVAKRHKKKRGMRKKKPAAEEKERTAQRQVEKKKDDDRSDENERNEEPASKKNEQAKEQEIGERIDKIAGARAITKELKEMWQRLRALREESPPVREGTTVGTGQSPSEGLSHPDRKKGQALNEAEKEKNNNPDGETQGNQGPPMEQLGVEDQLDLLDEEIALDQSDGDSEVGDGLTQARPFLPVVGTAVRGAERQFMEDHPEGFLVTSNPGQGMWCLLFALHRLMANQFPGREPTLLELYVAYRRVVARRPLVQGVGEQFNFRVDVAALAVAEWARDSLGLEVRIGVLRRQMQGEQWATIYDGGDGPDGVSPVHLWLRHTGGVNSTENSRGHFEPIFRIGTPPDEIRRLGRQVRDEYTLDQVERIRLLEDQLQLRGQYLADMDPIEVYRLWTLTGNVELLGEELESLYGPPNRDHMIAQEMAREEEDYDDPDDEENGAKGEMDKEDLEGDEEPDRELPPPPLKLVGVISPRGYRNLPVWDGSTTFRPIFIPRSLEPDRFIEIEVDGQHYLMPSSLWKITEPIRGNLSDATAAYLWDLASAMLPTEVDQQVGRILRALFRTVNVRAKFTVQPIWRVFAKTGNPLLAIILMAWSRTHCFLDYFEKTLEKMGFDREWFRPGLTLRVNQNGDLVRSIEGEADFVLRDWRPDLMNRKYKKGSTRKLDDLSFRRQCERDGGQLDQGFLIGQSTQRQDKYKRRDVEISFGDYFVLDPKLLQRMYSTRPYTQFERTAAQREFATRLGNSMVGEAHTPNHTPNKNQASDPNETPDQHLENRQDKVFEWEEKIMHKVKPGRKLMMIQVRDVLNQVVEFVADRLSTTVDQHRQRDLIQGIQLEIRDMPRKDDRDSPLRERYSFKHYFLEGKNRKRLNEFMRSRTWGMIRNLFAESILEVLRTEIDRQLVKATTRHVELITGDRTPTPRPRKYGQGKRIVAPPALHLRATSELVTPSGTPQLPSGDEDGDQEMEETPCPKPRHREVKVKVEDDDQEMEETPCPGPRHREAEVIVIEDDDDEEEYGDLFDEEEEAGRGEGQKAEQDKDTVGDEDEGIDGDEDEDTDGDEDEGIDGNEDEGIVGDEDEGIDEDEGRILPNYDPDLDLF